MLSDPYFYLVSVPAVLLYGIAKGGFGGAVAVLSVPLMALVMSPTLAAAILLPILVLMDGLVVRTYRGCFDRTALVILLPGAMVGIGLGYVTADLMNDDHMRMIVGVLALAWDHRAFDGAYAASFLNRLREIIETHDWESEL